MKSLNYKKRTSLSKMYIGVAFLFLVMSLTLSYPMEEETSTPTSGATPNRAHAPDEAVSETLVVDIYLVAAYWEQQPESMAFEKDQSIIEKIRAKDRFAADFSSFRVLNRFTVFNPNGQTMQWSGFLPSQTESVPLLPFTVSLNRVRQIEQEGYTQIDVSDSELRVEWPDNPLVFKIGAVLTDSAWAYHRLPDKIHEDFVMIIVSNCRKVPLQVEKVEAVQDFPEEVVLEMEELISVECHRVPLEDVLDNLCSLTGLTLEIDSESDIFQKPMSYQVSGMSIGDTLKLIFRAANLKYSIENRTLRVWIEADKDDS